MVSCLCSSKKYQVTLSNAAKIDSKVGAAIDKHESFLARLQTRQRNQQKRQEIQSNALAALAAVGTVVAPIKFAIDHEAAMANVKKVVDFSSEESFKVMGKSIIDMSRKIAMTWKEFADIAAAGGELGIAEKDILSFTETAVKMGVAFDITGGEAGEMMGKWWSSLGLNHVQTVK